MRVIIVGGGIGGIATYHSLLKHLPPSSTVDLYEAYSPSACKSAILGGAITVGPNGQRAIASITPAAIPYILERGFQSSVITVRNDFGKTLAQLPFGSPDRYGYSSVMVSRAIVYEGLMLGADTDARIHWSMRVKRVWETEEAAHVEFEDGSIESCDWLIGADGAKSKTRDALFDDNYATQYEGMTGFCGVVPISNLSPAFQEALRKQPSATMTLSTGGHLGLSLSSPPSDADPSVFWFTSIELSSPPARDTPPGDLKAILLGQYKDWKSPFDTPEQNLFAEVMSVSCSSTRENSFLILPRWYTPPLPYFTSLHGLASSSSSCGAKGRGRIVLIGDAAHAMPPDAAQGVSLAVEDALVLALVLKHYLSTSKTESEAIPQAAKSYEDIRLVRVNKILVNAKARQNRKKRATPIQQWVREKMVWMASFLPEWFMNDEIFAYDVEHQVATHLGITTKDLLA
ncbi:hypothetical protein GYMLUDRAFT_226184 [Collybiopsis luxurians FD-317 M1]|uniref:FAD-binding domain-containing protein n=1 Tax=Collybiopsis luxurians FD-317 M1 TaxID=944289 RepID=A0A0D0B952_9AGAR|nr:hypothetical protein GYMLUDRAFT_226184 [Collybiopsis luxurians FD-317 M1]